MKKIIFLLFILLVLLRGSVEAQRTKRNVKLPEKIPTSFSEKTGWKMLWHDEFDNDSIDYHVWWPQTNENVGTLTAFTQRLDNVSIKDGYLHLVNRKEGYHGYPYTGGMVFSAQKIEVNSRIEASFKIPKGKSLWPCLWLLGGKDSIYQEVDIAEFKCSKPTEFQITNHFSNPKKVKNVKQEFRTVYTKTTKNKPLDLSENFHVYAAEWTTNQLRFFLDDILIYELNRHVPRFPMHLILSMGVGGLDGNPTETTVFPAEFTFDYVRIYAKTEKK